MKFTVAALRTLYSSIVVENNTSGDTILRFTDGHQEVIVPGQVRSVDLTTLEFLPAELRNTSPTVEEIEQALSAILIE